MKDSGRLLENVPFALLMVDLEGRVRFANRRAGEIFGYAPDELEGSPIGALVPERSRAAHDRMVDDFVGSPEARPMGAGRDLAAVRKDGTEFPAEVALNPVEVDRQRYVLATVVDITERRRLEEQLRQSQKMEAIGRLAGGVAHDFNNLLTAILGSVELFRETLPDDHPVEDLEALSDAARRATELTRQLLAFGRKQVLLPRPLDLNEVVGDAERLLLRVIGEDVRIETRLAEDLGTVSADPGQIGQVLLNLSVNARDAMPAGGRLTIETANASLDEQYAAGHVPVVPGPYVMLALGDTGHGMDRETQEHIFEPFFTTKDVGKGTGLGLSTVFGIVKQSGGYIWVYSEPGQGTTFKIYFPRVEDEVAEAEGSEPTSTPRRSRTQGGERILLVEDDDAVRRIASLALRRFGYQVQVARNGEDALRIAEKGGDTIDLVVTDVVMPGLSGGPLVARLRELCPGAGLLITSGYAADAISEEGLITPETHFLEKPFTASEIGRKVREAIEGRSFSSDPTPLPPEEGVSDGP